MIKEAYKNITKRRFYCKKVLEYYDDLKRVKADDSKLVNALKLGKRCFALVDQSKVELSAPPTKSKYRKPGGGREVQQALCDWFIGMRETLKVRLPKPMFKAQTILFYDQWLAQQLEAPTLDEIIVFSSRWMNNWLRDYNVSLRKPNKRYFSYRSGMNLEC